MCPYSQLIATGPQSRSQGLDVRRPAYVTSVLAGARVYSSVVVVYIVARSLVLCMPALSIKQFAARTSAIAEPADESSRVTD